MTEHLYEPKVSVIIVTYNSELEIQSCLNSIINQEVQCEIFVVDNDSSDGTKAILEKYEQNYQHIKIILNKENFGLAYANNQPISMCNGDYILILNPDTVITDTITKLVDYLDTHPDIGVVGPKGFFRDGTPHLSAMHRWNLFNILIWRLGPYGIVRKFYDKFSSYKEDDVMYISGACLMIRRKIYTAIGGYDPNFFLTIEDVVDLCIRVKKKGYRVVFYPTADVIHLGGRSHQDTPYVAMYYSYKGSLYFVKKHKGPFFEFILRMLFVIGVSIKASFAFILSFLLSKRYTRIYEDNIKLVAVMLKGAI